MGLKKDLKLPVIELHGQQHQVFALHDSLCACRLCAACPGTVLPALQVVAPAQRGMVRQTRHTVELCRVMFNPLGVYCCSTRGIQAVVFSPPAGLLMNP